MLHIIREDRKNTEIRKTTIIPNALDNPAGSAIIECGKTKVICTAMIEESVPPWMENDDENGSGWLTARYGMLPGSGDRRIRRERKGARGRTKEIQRLIGRSLRAALDMDSLGPRTIWIDCDVLQADGGTRTASVTGGWMALMLAVDKLMMDGLIEQNPVIEQVAATSVGVVDDEVMLDLCFKEDFQADVDMNVVMDSKENYIEIQATGEGITFTREQHDAMLDAAKEGIEELLKVQKESIEGG
ncbi:MAG: ribonuclease PH [Thermoplasmata archaeon]